MRDAALRATAERRGRAAEGAARPGVRIYLGTVAPELGVTQPRSPQARPNDLGLL